MLPRPPTSTLFPYTTLFRSLICILTKNVITSCSVTMMLFLHLEVKPLMTLHERSEERFSRNAETDLVCRLLLEKKKAQQIKSVLSRLRGRMKFQDSAQAAVV